MFTDVSEMLAASMHNEPFEVRSQTYLSRSVCLSVRMQQLKNGWTNFLKI
jgi:hypothetical protein